MRTHEKQLKENPYYSANWSEPVTIFIPRTLTAWEDVF